MKTPIDFIPAFIQASDPEKLKDKDAEFLRNTIAQWREALQQLMAIPYKGFEIKSSVGAYKIINKGFPVNFHRLNYSEAIEVVNEIIILKDYEDWYSHKTGQEIQINDELIRQFINGEL